MFELEIEFSPICISNHLSGIYFAWIQHQPIGYWYNLHLFAFVSFHLISFDFTPSQSQIFSFSDQYSTRKYFTILSTWLIKCIVYHIFALALATCTCRHTESHLLFINEYQIWIRVYTLPKIACREHGTLRANTVFTQICLAIRNLYQFN